MTRTARLLMLAGPVAVVGGLSKYHAAVVAAEPYDFTASFRFPWALVLVGLHWLAAYGAGLPDARSRRSGRLVAAVVAVTLASLGVSVAQLATGSALLPRFVVLASALILVPWYLLVAQLAADAGDRARSATRAVVVGDIEDLGSLWADLESGTERPATVVAALTPVEAAATRQAAPLVEQVAASGANLVVLDSEAQQHASVLRQASALHSRGVRVRSMLAFYEEWLGKLPIGELERVSMMFDIAEIHGGAYARVKRLVDVACGVLAAGALVVVTPVVWTGNLVANRGPLWFRQERVGKDGRPFTMLKFRTMVPGGSGAAEWTGEDDPRVTAWGRVLRRTHLDELPQAWNILRGDLSVVGPRPEQPHYVEELAQKLPFYRHRHLVRPGLTGWAQVKYGYAADAQDALEKLQYEFFYLRHQGTALDLRIIARTVRSVVGGQGAGR